MEESRIGNSLRNLIVAWGGQAISVVLSFVTRGVFAYLLAKDYVGLESLFSNVITMLCVADMGIGSAIIFALYDPIAKNDIEKIKSLMRLFKRVYIGIGVFIALAGLLLAPFIGILIQDVPDIPWISGYFFCFVLNAAVSYFFSYKGSLIYAHQKSYKVSLIQYSFQIGMCLLQIAVLFITGSYWAYLVVMLLCTLGQNVLIARTADKLYPYLKEKNVEKIDHEVLDGIKKNTFALILHKISGAMSVSIGSIFISAFTGLASIASYGSYMIVLNSITRILDKAFDAVIASIGNIRVTEEGARQYSIFKAGYLVSAALYTVVCVVLACVLDDFIALWLGESYVFPRLTTYLLCFWLFVKGIRSAEQAFTSAYGLYWHTRYKALAEAIAMPIAAYIGVVFAGVDGVVVSGIAVLLLVATVLEVHGLYAHGLNMKGELGYWALMLRYTLCYIVACVAALAVCSLVGVGGVLGIALKIPVVLIVSITIFIVANMRLPEFVYLRDLAIRILSKSKNRKR